MLCYESPRGTSRMFFSLYTGVVPAICSYYKLYADGVTEQGRVSVLKKNLNTKNNVSYVKTVLKKF